MASNDDILRELQQITSLLQRIESNTSWNETGLGSIEDALKKLAAELRSGRTR